MGAEYRQLIEQRDSIHKWLASEEEGFGRTLVAGSRLLQELISRAREEGAEGISAADAFLLHDTHGFPIDLTLELVAEHGLGVDEEGFESLMEDQRNLSRNAPRAQQGTALRAQAQALASDAGFSTDFKGYESTSLSTTVGAVTSQNGHVLVKLVESPFYPTGGGQVADSGWIECADGDCRARVEDVVRLGEDQVVALVTESGHAPQVGERVLARVDHTVRHATECNHTATHLLHAALRARLGTHVRQAGSYVGPDKLRFDFTHGNALSSTDLKAVEDAVNGWITSGLPVRSFLTTLPEAKALGAMALFGEKYGEVVRMIEIGDGSFSRELCGGTHVRSTAEIALLKITSETSSAANVRRIEAVTGPVAVELMREHDRLLTQASTALRVPPERVPGAISEAQGRIKELERTSRQGRSNGRVDVDAIVSLAAGVKGATVVATVVPDLDAPSLLAVLDGVKAKLPDAAIVLGSSFADKVALVAAVPPALVQRGVKAGEIIKLAAAQVGGGGGGRDTLAQAGGKDPAKLPEAIAAARAAIEAALD
jgi:alanyl-tRNA synthetase